MVAGITASVYRCDLHLAGEMIRESCTDFTINMLDPRSIVVDTVRELVYIADFTYVKVQVFTYEGKESIARLGDKSGSLIAPTTGMSFRPGYYAPSSTFNGPHIHDKLVAGIPIKIPLSLRDVYNADVDDASLIDAARFSVRALGSGYLSDGTYLENAVTFRGPVTSATSLVSGDDSVFRAHYQRRGKLDGLSHGERRGGADALQRVSV